MVYGLSWLGCLLLSYAVLGEDQKQTFCPKVMQFGWGDAVDDYRRCTVDPTGKPINTLAMRLLSSTISGAGRFVKVRARSDDGMASAEGSRSAKSSAAVHRDGRMLSTNVDLFSSLKAHTMLVNQENGHEGALARSDPAPGVCSAGCEKVLPESCCEVRTEVAYPQFGQSAITEETFTIIQDFPDFVQPVFKRVCMTSQCNLIIGNCTQKFVPHAVFSAPSGKFGNLFGQDYLLVESGCECMPYFRARPAQAVTQAIDASSPSTNVHPSKPDTSNGKPNDSQQIRINAI